MENNQNNSEAKKGGSLPQIAIYQKIASREEEIISKLFELIKSRNENIALGATKTLLNKIIPDLRALVLSGIDSGPILIKVINYGDNDPLKLYANTPDAVSLERPTSLSSPELAQESPQNDISNQSIGKVG